MREEDMEQDLLKLSGLKAPAADASRKADALARAMQAFEVQENNAGGTQASRQAVRQSSIITTLWSRLMTGKSRLTTAFATLLLVPAAGWLTFQYVSSHRVTPPAGVSQPAEFTKQKPVASGAAADKNIVAKSDENPPALNNPVVALAAPKPLASLPAKVPASPAADAEQASETAVAPLAAAQRQRTVEAKRLAPQTAEAAVAPEIVMPEPSDTPQPPQMRMTDNRFTGSDVNPVKSVVEEPVSTFSVDVDTASYAFVRQSLNSGSLPEPDSVRVEEMINYFPYDWPKPALAEEPFRASVTVLPTPWNRDTQLMHVAIQGYDLPKTSQPDANLVFLIDVSGSMDEPNKLPLLKSAFRLLVNRLKPTDTVSIVTYAGDSGVVLEPTKARERDKILAAIDALQPGGGTNGASGIEQAYALAKSAFVKQGVNRVMLATDGDFNLGPSDDGSLKRMIEEKRRSGIFLSVLGFGNDNYNDSLMQVLAQNGNGTAAYIDSLPEAEKALVEEAGSTLFPIARDVKIQVEFNPARIAEYRLIGYETRALARQDFNNDAVDAGDIGSGHRVTAIYEITPKGSPATRIDDLRYGKPQALLPDDGEPAASADELAYVKIRWKKPDGDKSNLITQPVTARNVVPTLEAAAADIRFSIAAAAFGQKLKHEPGFDSYGYDQILTLATPARGQDPFGYRAEFLNLLRLAEGLTPGP